MRGKQMRVSEVMCVCVAGLLLVAGLPTLSMAAQLTLPPRPTPPSTTTPVPVVPSQPLSPKGAYIALNASAGAVDAWTIVQWQDAFGGWHDVDGWQGAFDEMNDGTGQKVWWVAEKDFETGPFRWVVYQDGTFLAASESFYLPGEVGQTVTVMVPIKQ